MIRQPLREMLVAAWSGKVRSYYERGIINSEGALQAALWSALMSELESRQDRDRSGWAVFVTPKIHGLGADDQVRIPDFVVTNQKQVIAVIEIKYAPRADYDTGERAGVRKDLETLRLIKEKKSDLRFKNERYAGDREMREFDFATDVLFVWAGVHQGAAPDLADLGRECSLVLGSAGDWRGGN